MAKIKIRSSGSKLKIKKRPKLTIAKGKRDEIDIFKLGTLVQFETHCWIGSKRMSKEESSLLSSEKAEWIKNQKNLIDRKKLVDIRSIIQEARNILAYNSLPFPIKGIHFLPKDKREEVNEKLKDLNESLQLAVDEFAEEYRDYIEDARENLGEFFNEADYPVDIKRTFSMHWRFFEMTIPSGITDEAYEEESRRFKEMMEETKQISILALREGFAEIVEHLTDTLSGKMDGKPRRVRQDSIDKIAEFFDEFQNKNVFKDDALSKLIQSAKTVVAGVTPKDLNSDKKLTKEIAKELKTIGEELNESIETVKRKLSF